MSEPVCFQGAAADIKSAIKTLSDVKGAESIVEALERSFAATKMLMHSEWSQRSVWVSYPNGFLATIVEMPDGSDSPFVWYIRPTGFVNEQYGLPPLFTCAACGPDMLYVRRGYSDTLQAAKEKIFSLAEELLEIRSNAGLDTEKA